jgi:hypothetical protein
MKSGTETFTDAVVGLETIVGPIFLRLGIAAAGGASMPTSSTTPRSTPSSSTQR